MDEEAVGGDAIKMAIMSMKVIHCEYVVDYYI